VLALAAAGCTFSETIAAPPGQPTVIAQMVLNTAAPVQKLLLERSDGGDSRVPLTGATVRLTVENPSPSCPRPTVTLVEAFDSVTYGAAGTGNRVYQTRELCVLHTGDRVSLRIETPQGDVVTGTTQIPGANRIVASGGTGIAGGQGVVSFDRTRDSLHVQVDPAFAQAIQIVLLRKGGNPPRHSDRRPTSTVFDLTTDTMHATIAGNLVDPFADSREQTTFRAGADYLFSVAPTDANYFDFVRSGANPFTGRGFINHLTGGIGVFGSVAPKVAELRVTAPQHDPREGLYQITGTLTSGARVNLLLDVYLDALNASDGLFSALTDGSWVEGAVRSSADGDFSGGLHAEFYGIPADPNATLRPLYLIDYTGALPARGAPFTAVLTTVSGPGKRVTDRVTIAQISGP
jgi:hypothetical protein